jgi:hypothetical protein
MGDQEGSDGEELEEADYHAAGKGYKVISSLEVINPVVRNYLETCKCLNKQLTLPFCRRRDQHFCEHLPLRE